MSPKLIVNNFLSADHPCAKHNGGCSQLCLIKPGGYSCLCPREIAGPCQTIPASTLSTTTVSVSLSSSLSLSKVKSSPSQLTTTTPFSSASMSSSVHPTPNFCSVHELCQNGGSCQEDGPSYKCLCIGYFVGRHCSIDISKFSFVIIYKRHSSGCIDFYSTIANPTCEHPY